ncbi:flavodoxin family protein [Agathobaculum sp. Marseille-P7918]|uniref:flavodoxin family protein n=1 Tax=Agathobaculum sp. Marseille-P7918 TaxID=2479843 RepID=UPI0035667FC6
MKVVAINGSPRKGGNCAQMLEVLGGVLAKEGIEFEVCQPGAKVHPCMACYHCLNNNTLRCVQADDGVNEIIEKCIAADAIVLASPVYHGGIAGSMKCVMDRIMLAACCGENQFHHKVGAALCTLRRSGGMETYQQLLGLMDAMEMVLVTSDYWNAVHGADIGECKQDIEGVEVIEKLGRNIAWMLKVIDKAGIAPPETHSRTMFNYIR